MTKLEKAARMALEEAHMLILPIPAPEVSALELAKAVSERATKIAVLLTQALATTEHLIYEDGSPGPATTTGPVCACGDRPASQCDEEWGPQCDLGNNPKYARPATTERKGEPIGEIVRSFGTGSGLEVRLFGGLTSDTPGIIGTKLYTSPQVPEDVQRDAERYRWLRSEHERNDPLCHLTWKRNMDRSEWRWVNTANFDAAIDAARKGG